MLRFVEQIGASLRAVREFGTGTGFRLEAGLLDPPKRGLPALPLIRAERSPDA